MKILEERLHAGDGVACCTFGTGGCIVLEGFESTDREMSAA